MLIPSLQKHIQSVNRALAVHGLFPRARTVTGSTLEPEIVVDGRRVLQFCNGNYLGLGNDPRILLAHIGTTASHGVSASGSRRVTGTQEVHLELEREIARFMGEETALVTFLVSVCTQGLLPGVLRCKWRQIPQVQAALGDVELGRIEVFFDQYTHPTVRSACVLAQPAAITTYRHADLEHLEKKLKTSRASTLIIATDGVFSAHGDVAPLPDLVELAERYEAALFVDDSHGTGILGPHGRGTWDHFGLDPRRIDFKVGSLAKAFATGMGGFVVGAPVLTEYLRDNLEHYIFGGSMPPAHAKAATTALRIAREEPWRRQLALERSDYLRSQLQARGFDTLGARFHITPILIGREEDAFRVQRELEAQGIYVWPFHYPAIPRGRAILRVNVTALHTVDHLDRFVEALSTCARGRRLAG
ncbi:MAG: pyridoxal phosphate-dependent aminotransferase family protein [Armatimonadetes bacterium]|nr:pyridoxal phosphate-dependent aminotransferase family protein [Armatimonadota bacterium]